ncbi:hypothetical protein BKA93DRAFT_505113 [Sparassis latifolia]
MHIWCYIGSVPSAFMLVLYILAVTLWSLSEDICSCKPHEAFDHCQDISRECGSTQQKDELTKVIHKPSTRVGHRVTSPRFSGHVRIEFET